MSNENSEFDKLFDEAEKYFKAGDYAKTIECFEKIPPSYEKYNNVLLNLGETYGAKDEYDNTIKDHNEAIRINSNDEYAYYNKGN